VRLGWNESSTFVHRRCHSSQLEQTMLHSTIGIHEYQRVDLKLPQEPRMSVYLRGRRENPPFVWLEFGFDVRRLSA
jgi:hypothetical protein